jgi:TPR repeat protein
VEEAGHWFQSASKKGNADALFNLGLLLEAGKGKHHPANVTHFSLT